jgi:pyruvate kinase
MFLPSLHTGAPVSRPGVRSLRSTLTSLPLITAPVSVHRKTKVIATMGPKCWDEDMLNRLIDAGVDIIRLNFR